MQRHRAFRGFAFRPAHLAACPGAAHLDDGFSKTHVLPYKHSQRYGLIPRTQESNPLQDNERVRSDDSRDVQMLSFERRTSELYERTAPKFHLDCVFLSLANLVDVCVPFKVSPLGKPDAPNPMMSLECRQTI